MGKEEKAKKGKLRDRSIKTLKIRNEGRRDGLNERKTERLIKGWKIRNG